MSEVVEEMDQTDKTEDMDDLHDEDDTSLIEEFDKGMFCVALLPKYSIHKCSYKQC